ncbi:MAG: YihY/virulence factor BrkB family protein [Actinomycetota bacterium]|nr:YihY/virulence factor BrkB family protein [Actinomycetota bacterium]
MRIVDRALTTVNVIDRWQIRHRSVSVVVATYLKAREDKVGSQSALFSYYALFAILPLAALSIGILALVLQNNVALQRSLLKSAFASFPIVGTDLLKNSKVLKLNSATSTISSLVILYSSLGLSRTAITSIRSSTFNSIVKENPIESNTRRLLWTIDVIVGSTLSTYFASIFKSFVIIGPIVAVAISTLMFTIAIRIAIGDRAKHFNHIRAAVTSSIALAILQVVGAQIIDHKITQADAIYGFFAIVIGVLSWLYLISYVTLLSINLEVVIDQRLFPRAILIENRTEADERSLELRRSQLT